MRYSASLRTSQKGHILKSRFDSGLIVVLWFAVALLVILLFIGATNLSLPALVSGFLASLIRTTTAYCFALVLALILALIITLNQTVENLLLPVFDVLQSFPSFALFPILVRTLSGSPEIVIVSVLVIAMIWPILFSIIGGLKNRRVDLEEAATVFGATGPKRLWHFTLPTLRPAIVTGSIVGWGEGWDLIIGAELLVSVHYGIGHYLGQLSEAGQGTLLTVGIIFLMFVLFIVNKLVWLPLLHRATEYETES